MNMHYNEIRPVRRIKQALFAAGTAALLLTSQTSYGTPISLAQSPLFLAATAPANIFFLTDDSGSMDWQMVTGESDGVMYLTAGGNTTKYTYLFPDPDNEYGNSDSDGRILPEENDMPNSNMPSHKLGVWRGRFHGYNKVYYNPDVNYLPWPGVDSGGNPLPNAKATASDSSYISVTAVRVNPFSTSSSTVDLTSAMTYTSHNVPLTNGATTDISNAAMYAPRYFTWTDSDSDGVVDAGDTHTMYEIRTSGACSSTCPATFTRASTRTDCATSNGDGTRTCTATEELKNFANWYMYYRRRELTAKNAIGNVIAPKGSEVRIGHATLHNNSGNSNIQIATMNTSTTSGNKRSVLNAVYRTRSEDGTPLRTKLYETGRYFECSSGSIFGGTSSYTCPWLSAANGGTCQQSFTILMTDGYYNDTFNSLPGTGNVDADDSSPNASGNTSFDGGAYADGRSQTLADVAMHFYERDLRSSLANSVPVIAGVDNATHQHMVTYGVAFGVTGTLSAGPSNPGNAFSWPNPNSGDLEKIDDLRHAAYNGRGQFLSANDPTTLADSLRTSIDSITERTGSASAVAVNSRALNTGSALYQARFTSVQWSGDLRAIGLDANTGEIGSQLWSAKDRLATQSASSRTIITYHQKDPLGPGCSGGPSVNGGVPFQWASLSQSQQCYLNDNPATGALDDDGRGSDRINYLRGDTSNEGTTVGTFRVREGGFKLGDIINSTPVFVGAPVTLPDSLESVAHSTFRSTYTNRREMIYVGANDGMLHGFAAATGEERIAYVPARVYANLSKLTDLDYRNNHKYFVDGSPAVGDAFGNFANGCSGTACWRSVLVSGLAGGGKGIFALDVTDPDGIAVSGLRFDQSNAANLALWEFVDSTSAIPDNDMGYVYGEVSIAKMRNGRWAAVFGNGYNSANENAVLYVVDIVNGTLIRKIVLNPYAPGSATGNSNGLSAPVVFDRDNDFVADYIYAGDLRGNLWKVDVTDSNPNNWNSAHVNGGVTLPLFRAVDTPGSDAQAITARPIVRAHPGGQTGFMVYIGTGRYIADGDRTPSNNPINSFYGIWDSNVNSTSTPVTRATLRTQTITQTTVNGQGVRVVSSNPIDWTTHKGFVLDLRTNQSDSLGEMSVTNPVLASANPERIIFTTLVPEQSTCSYGGTGWLMEISPTNGGNLGVSVFDVNNDGVVDAADTAGGSTVSGINPGLGIMPEPVIVHKTGAQPLDLKLLTGSTGNVKSIKNYLTPPGTPPGSGTGRRSWRQLQ